LIIWLVAPTAQAAEDFVKAAARVVEPRERPVLLVILQIFMAAAGGRYALFPPVQKV